MERVHFQQEQVRSVTYDACRHWFFEQMLPELKDLAEKGIFTEVSARPEGCALDFDISSCAERNPTNREAKDCIRDCSRSPSSQKGRLPPVHPVWDGPGDATEKKSQAHRCVSSGPGHTSTHALLALPKSPATVSDYAFVRRVFHIFERALKRFKSDVGLWTQYIQVAKREGAKALVGRITARSAECDKLFALGLNVS